MKLKTKKAAQATAKKTAALLVVKFTKDALLKLGFERAGKETGYLNTSDLERMGRSLQRHGLTETWSEWWYQSQVVSFQCGDRAYSINVVGFAPSAGRWKVEYHQGPDELEQWLEKRPEGHPERTSLLEATLPTELLARAMRHAKAQGIDNCEDFVNKLLTEFMQADAFAVRLGEAVGDRVVAKLKSRRKPTV